MSREVSQRKKRVGDGGRVDGLDFTRVDEAPSVFLRAFQGRRCSALRACFPTVFFSSEIALRATARETEQGVQFFGTS